MGVYGCMDVWVYGCCGHMVCAYVQIHVLALLRVDDEVRMIVVRMEVMIRVRVRDQPRITVTESRQSIASNSEKKLTIAVLVLLEQTCE